MDPQTISAGYTGLKGRHRYDPNRSRELDLQGENRTLKDKLREQEVWTARASKYELVVAPGGATVYRSKESPQHYACPVCYEAKQIQILQDGRAVARAHKMVHERARARWCTTQLPHQRLSYTIKI